MRKILTASALLLSMVSMASANVSIASTSYQKMTKVLESGEKVEEWARTSTVVPGMVIRYVNSLENRGEKEATKLVVKNSVPNNMEYIADTASCQDACIVTYSIDGGKSFKKASELFLGEGKDRHQARPSEYTDIRWVVEKLDASSQSSVEYRARLK